MSDRIRIPQEIFYYQDDSAPMPNVPLHPGVSAVVLNGEGKALVMKRAHGDYWCLPGGRIDQDESAQQCCVRETFEETGLKVEVVRLISSNTDPRSVVHYPDGNVHRSFALCFEAKIIGGMLSESSESSGFAWIGRDDLDKYRLIPDSRLNLNDWWSHQAHCIIR